MVTTSKHRPDAVDKSSRAFDALDQDEARSDVAGRLTASSRGELRTE
jgi:hypothetical protein